MTTALAAVMMDVDEQHEVTYSVDCPSCHGRFVVTIWDVVPVCRHCGYTFTEEEAMQDG